MMMAVVLTIASLVSAAAYNTATVTNASEFTITTTSESRLALIPKPNTSAGNKDGVASISDGELRFNFGAMQPNSTYTWEQLFKVKNNSQETVNINIGTAMDYVAFSLDGTTYTLGSASTTNVAPGAEVNVSVRIQIPAQAGSLPVPSTGAIIVTATAQ